MAKDEKVEAKKYELVQVATQHELAIQSPEGEVMSINEAIVLLLNEVKEIKKVTAG